MTEKEVYKFGDFVINISKFLSRYYNINSQDAKRLSHFAFKEIFNLDSVSIYNISVLDIIKGDKILVCDVDGVVRGYDNSYINIIENEITTDDNSSSFDLQLDEMNESFNLDGRSLSDLSDYELDKLLYLSKKARDERTKNKIIRELKFRPESKPGAKQKIVEKVRKREFENKKMKGDLL